MGFRKRNAKRSDNRSSAKVIMGKPASQLSKEEKKILSARMAEIRSENGGKNTVQNTIPFLCMYQDGVCQVSENFFSLTVQFYDANYSISEFDEQNNIFSKYCDVINLFDNTIKFQLTFENQNRSKAKLVKTVQIPEQDDDFNSIRKEYSEMLTDKLLKGSNGQSARKFLTFGIESTSYKAARAKLMSIKNDVIKGFKAFGVEAELLDGRQRLEALYYALNPYRNSPFIFDWDSMLSAGMDTKDFICPPSLKFNKSDFEIGNAYGAVWGMNILAGELPDEILKDFLEMQNLFCVNIHVEPLDQIDALKFVKKKLTNVEQMKIDEQKKASQSGYDPDILPPAIKMYIEDIEKLLGDLNSKNERLFHISISLRAYAKSKKDLKLLSEMLKRTCQKNNCTMFPYDYRQEQTLVSTLPLCYNEIPVRREMHTSGIAIFVPFTTKELFQDGQATYYGINTLSGNMIRANRSRLKNPNGLILGTPGAGKSFSVKREILDCFLTTVDDIIICDPEGEYFPLVSALHGQLIRTASNSEQHINPMDITIDDYRMEYIPVHPMDKLVVPRAERYEATFYNKDELSKLFEVFKDDKLELIVHIAAYYGLRRSEVLGLRWDAIDFTNKTITIQRKVVSDYDGSGQRKLYVENRLKTNSTRRTLPLIPHIERMLLERKELEAHFKKISGRSYDKEFEGFVCRDSFGKLIAPEYVTSRFHYVITKAGLRHLRFHDLRHSCASLLLANDVPMKAIQEWLGHSNYTITANLYSHLEYNAKVVSAETIARVLDGESLEQTKAPAETVEPAPEKKSMRKKSASKKPAAKKTSDKKTASTNSTAKTTDEPAPKRTGGRKKKSDMPPATGKSQTSTL